MTIKELAVAIKENNLSKDKLEAYHIELTCLYAEMSERLADLEKAEAVFQSLCEEPSRAGAERKWNATSEGLELIGLKRSIKAVEKLASSVKHRIYNYL